MKPLMVTAGVGLAACFALPMVRGMGIERSPLGEVVDDHTLSSVLVMLIVPHLFGASLAWRHATKKGGAITALLAVVACAAAVGVAVSKSEWLMGAGLVALVALAIWRGRRWLDRLEMIGSCVCLWWFGCWAILATWGDWLTRMSVQPLYGLWVAIVASATALAVRATRG